MFSKACEYGIRALTVIAEAGKENKKIGIKAVCKSSQTPESFTAKILQNLVKRGILDSQKGPTGGFYITRDLDKITLYDIVEAVDGTGIFFKCGLGLAACDAKNPCPMHTQFEVVRDELNAMCKNNTLQDLVLGFHTEVFNR
ncbi:MAG: Rrf2 family iron-sulfur cluster assembly transcriptional regulator [Saprospiraceae bacterium]|jgi:Rrf2 family iron-sulfur cluster assembly transcriptional regulator